MRTKHDLEKGSKPIHVEGIETYISWKKEEGSSKTELRTYLTDLGWRAEQVDFFIKEYYVNPKVKREGFFRRVFHRLRRKSLEERVLQDIQTEIADPSEIFPPIVPSIEPRSQSYRLRPPEESLNEVFEHSEDEFQYSKIWTSQCIAKLVASEAYAHLRMSENIPELQIRKEMSERNIVIGDNSMDKMFDNYS